MSGLYDINGKVLETGQNSKSNTVNTDAYENNYNNVFSEDFKETNSAFVLSNCSVSDNGLSCSGFSSAFYNVVTEMDYHKALMKFVYSEDASLGVCLHDTLAYVDTANKTINICIAYLQGSVIPTATKSGSISFDFKVGNEYVIEVERKANEIIATITDSISGENVSIATTSTRGNAANTKADKLTGVVVFSGTTVINCFSYYAPFYNNHVKCLIVGDSITEGVGVTKITDRYSWKLLNEYFHNDAMICAIGGGTTEAMIQLAINLLEMGYSFDCIFVGLGTNDSIPADVLVDEYTAKYEGYIEQFKGYGSKVVWSVPPNPNTEHTKKAAINVTNADALVRFDLAMQTDGEVNSEYASSLHPSSAGHERMYEFAKIALDLMGV